MDSNEVLPPGEPAATKEAADARPGGLSVPMKYADLRSQLIAAHPDKVKRAYVDGRWLDAVVGARRSMKRDQRLFRRGNFVTLGAGAVSPVLITSTAASSGSWRTWLTVAAIIASLVAAVGSVLLQALRPGIRWRLHRTLRDQLEAIAWGHLIDVSTEDPGARGADSWARFVTDVEAVIREHNGIYSQEVAGVLTTSPTAEAAGDRTS